MSYSGPFPLPIVGGGTNQTTAPKFFAHLNTSVANVTGDGTIYTVLFDTADVNVTSSYNTGTGLFTAPVTGTYYFFTSIMAGNMVAATGIFIQFLVSTGVSYITCLENPFTIGAASGTQIVRNGSVILNLTAAQTIQVNFQAGGATKTVGITGAASFSNNISTFFGGYLLR